MNWTKHFQEHKIFTDALELYICKCLDNKVKPRVIKESLAGFVDIEVDKLKRVRKALRK